MVESGQAVWGSYDSEVRAVYTHGSPEKHEDLLNELAVVTLRSGGRTFAVPRERMPRPVPAAATFRY